MKIETPTFLDPVPFGDDPAGQRFLVLRYGRTDFTKGGSRAWFEFSEKDADAVIEDFRTRGKDLVMDYDHATVKGGDAPASGWISSLSKGQDGLYADVQWTPKAVEHLKAREYRYHSPVIFFNPKTGRPAKLHSIALTNHPAMHSYPPLVADDYNNHSTKETSAMNENIKALAKKLGVSVIVLDDGTEDEAATTKAINAKLDEMAASATSASEFLKLHNAKTFDDITGKIAGMVPASEKAELEAKVASMNAERLVSQALNDGKLVEAQKDWATAYAAKNPEGFNDFLKTCPAVAPGPASSVPAGTPPKTEDAKENVFSDEDLKIAAKMGVSAEDMKKFND